MARWINAKKDPALLEEYRRHHRENQRKYRAANPIKAKKQNKKDHRRLMSDPKRLEKKRHYAKERQRKYRLNNLEKVRASKRKSNYGLTAAQYAELLVRQEGLCAICHKPDGTIDRRTGKLFELSVDHDHATKKIRGLLCFRCNHGLGNFRDDADLLARASMYLKQSN